MTPGDSLIGAQFQQYRVTSLLGRGGMGVVYKARDVRLERDVAFKILQAGELGDETRRLRFLREARAASALSHPNIVTIHEIDSADGVDFIVMELVTGSTLHDVIPSAGLGLPLVVSYATQLLEGMAAAHRAGLVHRDLKPGNLMIRDDGVLKILDFGLATLRASDDSDTVARLTATGKVIGTLAYMSPEQARGEMVGPPSDVFSMGVILYQMVAGRSPFRGSGLSVMHALIEGTFDPLNRVRPECPATLAAVIERALEPGIPERLANAEEMLSAFKQATGAPVSHQSVPTESVMPAGPRQVKVTSAVGRATFGRTAAVAAARWTAVLRPARVALLAALTIAGTAGAIWGVRSRADPAQPSSNVPAAADTTSMDAATPRDLYLRARALLDRFDREGSADRAIPLLEQAVEKDRSYAMAYATLTEAYYHKNRVAPDAQWTNLMLQSAQRALTLSPELGAAHTAMGLAFAVQSGRAADAEAAFRRAIELDPRNAAPHYRLAAVLPKDQNAEKEVELQRALALDANNWAVLQELGVFYYQGAGYAQAADYLNKALTASPDNVRVLANLAAAYHMLARYEDSASTLQRAIEIQPSGQLFTNLGTLRFFQGRYDDAVAPFEKAVELSPNRYAYWGNLADAYRWSPGNKPKARATYQRAIQLLREQLAAKPDDSDLQSRLALYEAKAGTPAAATAALEKFDAAIPLPAVVLFRLAVASEVLGARDRALRFLDRALQAGYAASEVRSEPELVNLRNDLRYHRIIAKPPGSGSR